GFPLHPQDKVVKIANHSEGLLLNPETDERIVYPEDREALDQFLGNYISPLQGQPIVFTRRCCYTDTLDGQFWIDKHPEIKGHSVVSGGSGHGFKMGPIIGKMIAAAALGEDFLYLDRHRWRTLDRATLQKEEARNLKRKQ
ncbi:MAG: FAD-dependent oxidoreductase, partial [Bacteroidetes bacterium]|nr:FAD-dependent oxidoreductase [Bacteroidota bacterium]